MFKYLLLTSLFLACTCSAYIGFNIEEPIAVEEPMLVREPDGREVIVEEPMLAPEPFVGVGIGGGRWWHGRRWR
jgi:hypothetical protein